MNTTDGGNQWTFIPGFPKHGREKHACFVNHGTNMLHVIGGKKYSLHSKMQQILALTILIIAEERNLSKMWKQLTWILY